MKAMGFRAWHSEEPVARLRAALGWAYPALAGGHDIEEFLND